MNSKYYLAAIFAFLIWGTFSLPLKALSSYSSFDILLSRVVFSSAVIVFLNLFIRKKKALENTRIFRNLNKIEKRNTLIINVISAILLAFNWYLFIYVMNRISVNATSLAYMLCPILTTFLAYLFLKEKLNKWQWFAVFLSAFSCALLSIGNVKTLIYSSIIAITYALYLVLQKKNHHLGRFFTLSFQILVGTILLLPLISLQQALPQKDTFYYGIILLIAVVFTILPMYLNVFALQKLNSSTVGIFIYINPLLSFLLAIFYFNEQIDAIQAVAYSLVLVSVFVFNYKFISKFLIKRSLV